MMRSSFLILLSAALMGCPTPSNPVATTGGDPDQGTTTAEDTGDQPDMEPDVVEPEDVPMPEDPGPGDDDAAMPPVDMFTPPKDNGPAPDTAPPVEEPPPLPDVTPDSTLCSEPGGGVNIYDLQNPDCPEHPFPEPTEAPGLTVELKDVVVTAVFGDTTFVQDPQGGPYSGIAVFTHGLPALDVIQPGMVMDIVGSYTEYFQNSQVRLTSWEQVGSQAVPEAFVIHPHHVSTNGAISEWFEGVLVRVENVETIHTKPDCPQDWGEFLVTGNLRVDDAGNRPPPEIPLWDARLGDKFTAITGPMTYLFGNTKIEPRTAADFDFTAKGGTGSTSKCIESDCIVPASVLGTKQVVVTELMVDPYGSDAAAEWIELHNPGAQAIDIQGWVLRDCGTQKITLASASGTLEIPAGGYILIGQSADPAKNGGLDLAVAYGNAFYLPNTVGSLVLFDGDPIKPTVIDQMRYSSFDPWESLVVGHSLQRTNPTNDGTQVASWVTGSGSYGESENQGTPGN